MKCNIPVVHQKHIKLLDVVDNELVETVGQDVAGLGIRT